MPQEPQDRIEREIDEILRKIDQFPGPAQRRQRSLQRRTRRVGDAVAQRVRGGVRWLSRFSISQVMLLSFLLILGSFFFRRVSPMLMEWVLIAGVVLFVSSFALMLFGGSRGGPGGSGSSYWRGRPISYDQRGRPSRLRRWFGSRSR